MTSWFSSSKQSSLNPLNWGSSQSTSSKVLNAINPLAPKDANKGFFSKAASLLPRSSKSSSWVPSILQTKDQKWFETFLGRFGINGSIATILSFLLYFMYLKYVKKDPRGLTTILKQNIVKIPYIDKIPFLNKLLPSKNALKDSSATGSKEDSKALVPLGTKAAIASLSSTGAGFLSKFNPIKWKTANKDEIAEQEDNEKYQAGEPYGDPRVLSISLVKELRAVGIKVKPHHLQTLIEVLKSKTKPIDDRQMTMEKMIAITAALPRTSRLRNKLTGIIINSLWSSLQHPPMSYLGNKYQYRTPDGSYNNPLQPDLGSAGSPYARSVQKLKQMHGVAPDPGLLFDLLMARTNDSFKENPAGVSSVLFYHATIIIHDVFRTNRFDSNISDTSSYLDLAPLYGSSLQDQLKIRTMKNGLLLPDTFHERRLLGQPPGVNAMLVMYSRFHNYVAETLLQINEYGRFTLPPTKTDEDLKNALAKQDNDLFQTARLIVGGLYVNISLHDYLRGLTNTHHSRSDWTLDPRVIVNKPFDDEGVPRGIGNQVSAEFNLLYRFHSVISLRDEKWLNEFLKGLFPGSTKPLDQLTPQEFVQGLYRFEQSIPEDPSKREFAGLKRGADGRFSDADLVNVMKASMEDTAGLFGPRMVPKALRMVEITGILTARKWQMASLNEMRSFFKLKPHDSFEDLNPDADIADLLRKLYDHPDMVEMYPGMFLEDAKPRMDPGCGGCPPYTVGRAVFSDAVTLVRSDRFYTLDYTPATLTNWGMQEVRQDYDVAGGSMFYKLFQRALPGWFPYNSLHIMQPMFTRKMNEQIAKEIGTIDQYTLADPKPPAKPVVLMKASIIQKVLKDQANFRVPWAAPLNDIFPGKKDYSSFMLGGDKAANTAQRNMLGAILYGPNEFKHLLSESVTSLAKVFLKAEALKLREGLQQIDIIRDVAIPLNARILADLFCLDLKTPENPTGSLNAATLYKHLLSVRTWGFNNNDPGMAWRRRMWAQDGATALTASTVKAITTSPTIAAGIKPTSTGIKGVLSKVPVIGGFLGGKTGSAKDQTSSGSLRWYGTNVVKEMVASGKTVEEAADICWLTSVAGVGAPIGVFADVLNYFFQVDNIHHWEDIQKLALGSNGEAADKTVRQYVLEAQRMTSTQRNLRVCVGKTTIDGQTFNPGEAVGPAGKDPETVPEPKVFKLDRPASAYMHFGYGPHECLGKEITITFVTQLIKLLAGLKNIRPAPGNMGELKSIMVGNEKCYLNSNWSWLTFDPTTWKLHFEGYGKGVYHPPSVPVNAGSDLNATSIALVKQDNEGPNNVTPPIKDPSKVLPAPISAGQLADQSKGSDLAKPTAALPSVPTPSGAPQPDPVPTGQGAVLNGPTATKPSSSMLGLSGQDQSSGATSSSQTSPAPSSATSGSTPTTLSKPIDVKPSASENKDPASSTGATADGQKETARDPASTAVPASASPPHPAPSANGMIPDKPVGHKDDLVGKEVASGDSSAGAGTVPAKEPPNSQGTVSSTAPNKDVPNNQGTASSKAPSTLSGGADHANGTNSTRGPDNTATNPAPDSAKDATTSKPSVASTNANGVSAGSHDDPAGSPSTKPSPLPVPNGAAGGFASGVLDGGAVQKPVAAGNNADAWFFGPDSAAHVSKPCPPHLLGAISAMEPSAQPAAAASAPAASTPAPAPENPDAWFFGPDSAAHVSKPCPSHLLDAISAK